MNDASCGPRRSTDSSSPNLSAGYTAAVEYGRPLGAARRRIAPSAVGSSGVVPAVQALVPRALGIQAEHRPHPTPRAVADDVTGRGSLLDGLSVPLERPKIPAVQEG